MRTWDYRVVKSFHHVIDEDSYCIHVVYYNEKGEITNISKSANYPIGNTLEDLKEKLELYSSALEKPVIDLDSEEFANIRSEIYFR